MTPAAIYRITEKIWQYNPPSGWYFITLPESISTEIRSLFGKEEEGWGRLKATAKTGNSEWKTSIWFDTKRNAYVLPIKAEIRKKEGCTVGDELIVELHI